MNKRAIFIFSSVIIVLILLTTTFAGLTNTQVSASLLPDPGNRSPTIPGAPADTVTITDANLEAALRAALSKPSGNITEGDLATLTSLNAANMTISSIQGIEYCINLNTLVLNNNQIIDISYLSGLASLQHLFLHFNQITDVSPLSGLTSLADLYLCMNPISDISPLAGLTNLQTLWFSYCSVTDISALSGLTGLTNLSAPGNGFTDISALSGMTVLNTINLSYNNISDISPLAMPGDLNFMNLSNNKITDITALKDNAGIGPGDTVYLEHNLLDLTPGSADMNAIEELTGKGVMVSYGDQARYTLTINGETGGCTVTKVPDLTTYYYDVTVNLTANTVAGWSFTSWGGVDTQSDNTANVVMNGDRTVTATFTEDTPPSSVNYTLEVNVVPSSGGHVNRYPWEPEFPAGTLVQLTAVPKPGWSFYHWSGNLTGSDINQTVLMDMNKSVTANFNHDYCFLNTTIHGSGNITVEPSKPNYNIGELVTLTAVPADGWVFAGWSGYVSSINNPIYITMNDDRYVTATFVNPNDLPPGVWWKVAGGGIWTRRAEVIIEEKSGANLANYQVKVEVPYRDSMKADFSDIRFLMMDNLTELSYWRQDFTPADRACFWVKVPYIPASGILKIYVYYGNPNAQTTSDIHNTFIFGDDFQDAAWTAANLNPVNFGGATQGISDGVYHMQGPKKGEPIAEPYENGSLKAFPPDYVAEIDFSPVKLAGGAFLAPRYNQTDDKYECWVSTQSSYTALTLKVGGMWIPRETKPLNFTIASGSWYRLKTAVVMDRGTDNVTMNYITIFVNDSPCIAAHDDSLLYPGLAFLSYDWENAFHIVYDNFRVRAYASIEPACEVKDEQMIALCAIRTISADNVSRTTANLSGSLDYLGFSSSVSVCFGWGLDESSPNTTEPVVMTSTGGFYASLSGLSPNTTYYFRAIGAGEFATTYGDTVSFITASPGGGIGGGGGGGGGSGGSGTKMITSLMNSITRDGKVILDIKASSPDLNVWLSIPKYTRCLNRVGAFLSSVTIETLIKIPDGLTDSGLFGAIYKFSPAGATFSPGITLTFRYKPSSLPDGLDVKKLKIVWWDNGRWVEMDTVVDTEKHTFSTTIDHFSYYSLMTVLLPPNFEISNLAVPPELARGEGGVAEAVVTNTGDMSGSYKVALEINGKVNEEKEITLDGGQETTLSFKLAFDESGAYTVKVNDIEKTLLVLASPALFTVEGLTINPKSARAGEEVVVSVTVTNSGELCGDCEVACALDGRSYASQKVTVEGNSSQEVSFSIISTEAGTHNIAISDALTGEFEIAGPLPTEVTTSEIEEVTPQPLTGEEGVPAETEKESGDTGVIIVIVAGSILLAAMITILVTRRSKRPKIKH